MASGSGKDQDDHIHEPVHGQREPQGQESSAAAATSTVAPVTAAAERRSDASSPPPPPAPPVESLNQERAREQQLPGDGDRGTNGSSSAAAAVDRKGKGKLDEASSPTPPLTSISPHLLSEEDAEEAIKDIEMIMASRLHWGGSSARIATAPLKARRKEEEKPDSPEKESLWCFSLSHIMNKILCIKERRTDLSYAKNIIEAPPLVNHQKIKLEDGAKHYFPVRYVLVHSNLENLLVNYSEFRPVRGDGDCFYRSFIVSYLEQVLDRKDTLEEHRLLATVEVKIKPSAMQIDYPKWASTFSRSYKAFRELIENVVGWKRNWAGVASTDSNCKKELFKFFNNSKLMDDIFVFLRIAAATWMCSHRDKFGALIPELGEGYTLEVWCIINLVPLREATDHPPMMALAEALGVSLRVESLLQRITHDIHTGAMGVPRVTVLYTGDHYDVIYPRHSEFESGSSSQQDAQGQGES